MAENLRQAHEIVARVFEVAVCHRVPQQVREDLEATDGCVLAAQIPHTPVSQRRPARRRTPDRSSPEGGTPGRPATPSGPEEGTGTDRCLPPLPSRKMMVPLRSPDHQVAEFEATRSPTRQPVNRKMWKIAAARTSPRSSTSLSSFADLAPVQPLRGKLLAA